MYLTYDFSFNGRNASDLGVYATQRPNIPAAERDIEYTDVPGRNGSLKSDRKTYRDVVFPMELNFKASPDRFGEKCRMIKAWLSGSGMLVFSDDVAFGRKVKSVSMSEIERQYERIGVFTAEFRCDPYEYVVQNQALENPSSIINQYDITAAPVYEITGNGLCTLTVNGNQFEIQTGGQTTAVIDADRMIAYIKDTGVVSNAMASGKYEDILLQTGENTFSITDGFTFKVIPNWRSL